MRHITDDWLKEARAGSAADAQAQTGTPVQAAARPMNDNQPAEARRRSRKRPPRESAKPPRRSTSAESRCGAVTVGFQTLSELQDKLDRTGARSSFGTSDPKTLMPAAGKIGDTENPFHA